MPAATGSPPAPVNSIRFLPNSAGSTKRSHASAALQSEPSAALRRVRSRPSDGAQALPLRAHVHAEALSVRSPWTAAHTHRVLSNKGLPNRNGVRTEFLHQLASRT